MVSINRYLVDLIYRGFGDGEEGVALAQWCEDVLLAAVFDLKLAFCRVCWRFLCAWFGLVGVPLLLFVPQSVNRADESCGSGALMRPLGDKTNQVLESGALKNLAHPMIE